MIKVFIPTYKRLATLKWVLLSLNNNLSTIENNTEIYIINNCPDEKLKVEKIIMEFSKAHNLINFNIIHREFELPAAISWYKSIRENSNYGDIIFLHGDDDLFINDSIKMRKKIIEEYNADFLISDFDGGLLFNESGEKINFNKTKDYNKIELIIKKLSFKDKELIGSIFLGNNCYKYSKKFENSLDLALKWCNIQTWVDENLRTQFLPFYITLAAVYLGFNVFYTNGVFVIRGNNINEIINSFVGVSNWNSGFISLLCLGILNSKELISYKELDHQRVIANKMAAEWFFTYFFDKRISSKYRKDTFQKIGYPKFNLNLILKAFKLFIFSIIKIKLKRFYKQYKLKKFYKNSINTKVFIDELKKFNED